MSVQVANQLAAVSGVAGATPHLHTPIDGFAEDGYGQRGRRARKHLAAIAVGHEIVRPAATRESASSGPLQAAVELPARAIEFGGRRCRRAALQRGDRPRLEQGELPWNKGLGLGLGLGLGRAPLEQRLGSRSWRLLPRGGEAPVGDKAHSMSCGAP